MAPKKLLQIQMTDLWLHLISQSICLVFFTWYHIFRSWFYTDTDTNNLKKKFAVILANNMSCHIVKDSFKLGFHGSLHVCRFLTISKQVMRSGLFYLECKLILEQIKGQSMVSKVWGSWDFSVYLVIDCTYLFSSLPRGCYDRYMIWKNKTKNQKQNVLCLRHFCFCF